jgi:hypothetical protein
LRPHLKSFEIVHNIHFQTFVSSLPLATAEALLKSTSPKTPFKTKKRLGHYSSLTVKHHLSEKSSETTLNRSFKKV